MATTQTHGTQAHISTRELVSHNTQAYDAIRTTKTHTTGAWNKFILTKTHTTRGIIESTGVITSNNHTKIDADTDASGYMIRDSKAGFVGFAVLDKGTSWAVTFYDALSASNFDSAHKICVYNTAAGAGTFKLQRICVNGLGYIASGTVAGNIVAISERMT